jgi:hypothetical protein
MANNNLILVTCLYSIVTKIHCLVENSFLNTRFTCCSFLVFILSTEKGLEHFTIYRSIERNLLWVKIYMLGNTATTLYKKPSPCKNLLTVLYTSTRTSETAIPYRDILAHSSGNSELSYTTVSSLFLSYPVSNFRAWTPCKLVL